MAFVRDIAHIVDAIICYVGFLFPLWDGKKQTLADKMVHTVVLKDGQDGARRRAASRLRPAGLDRRATASRDMTSAVATGSGRPAGTARSNTGAAVLALPRRRRTTRWCGTG